MIFSKKPLTLDLTDPAERDRDSAIEYIKTLDKPEFNRFIEAVKDIHAGWDKLLRIQTKEQKEDAKMAKAGTKDQDEIDEWEVEE